MVVGALAALRAGAGAGAGANAAGAAGRRRRRGGSGGGGKTRNPNPRIRSPRSPRHPATTTIHGKVAASSPAPGQERCRPAVSLA